MKGLKKKSLNIYIHVYTYLHNSEYSPWGFCLFVCCKYQTDKNICHIFLFENKMYLFMYVFIYLDCAGSSLLLGVFL